MYRSNWRSSVTRDSTGRATRVIGAAICWSGSRKSWYARS
jgi:hypothetical protein